MMKPIKIIDKIRSQNKYYVQMYYIVDRMPVFFYERKGNWLEAEDSGFFKFYFYEACGKNWKAFAGRKFEIPLKNGEKIKAYGQWWDGLKPDYQGLLVDVGIGTIEKLNQCNVFAGMWADPEILGHIVNPSNNYHKHDMKHPNFGKHQIESKWEKGL